MNKHVLRFLIFTALVNATLCVLKKNTYVKIKKSWSEARDYCKEHHTDLSTINSQEEDEELIGYWNTDDINNVWIGLQLDSNDVWMWVGGKKSSYFNWSNKIPPGDGNNCVVQSRSGWRNIDCATKRHFMCFEQRGFLVKENKTWEDAMDHCRQKDTDLVSLISQNALADIVTASKEAQTDHVWTGLRFLGDHWLWVDGENMEYQAWNNEETPQCPDWNNRCGALSMKGQHWDSWDCEDKLNFYCS